MIASQPATSRERARAKAGLFDLIDRITELRHGLVVRGIEPTEVWIGPGALAAVRTGMRAEPGLYGDSDRFGEGSRIDGLTVRLMAEEGTRVGVTAG